MRSICLLGLALFLMAIAMPSNGAIDFKAMIQAKGIANTNASLEGVSWALDSYIDQQGNTADVLPSTEITALFESGRLSGSGGCNSYSAAYVANGNKINISKIISTMMMCAENISNQESMYLGALEKAAAYNATNDSLEMMDANGTVILTYSPARPLALNNTAWEMITYNNGKGALVSALAGTRVTALFHIDGNLTGSAGCNNYNADYKVNDSNIKIGPIAATRMYCAEPNDVMDQESSYLAALASAVSYKIDEKKLTLLNGNNTAAVTYQRWLE